MIKMSFVIKNALNLDQLEVCGKIYIASDST